MKKKNVSLRNQIVLVLESYKYNISAEEKKIAETIRKALESVYSNTPNWGKIETEDCQTRFGVINVFPHSSTDQWSILNRFDTNTKVRNELVAIKNHEDQINKKNSEFFRPTELSVWIMDNKERLFKKDFPNGLVQSLVDLNIRTIDAGNRNETYAFESLRKVLEEKYGQGQVKLRRFCSGSIMDTLKGVDIEASVNGTTTRYQVKPFTTILSKTELDGTTFFEVRANVDTSKYKTANVDAFLFVNERKGEYILFDNDKNKIGEIPDGVRFYEAPLITNIEKINNMLEDERNSEVSNLFGASAIEKKIANLEYRKKQITDLIEYYKGKLKYNY